MRYKISLLFICILAMFVPSDCRAEPEQFRLRVGYWMDYGVSQEEDGRLYGYGYEYMNEIAKRNSWQIEFVPCEWSQGMEMLRKGEIDIFGPMEKTPEREKLFDYTDESFGYEYGALYVSNYNNTIYYNDVASIDGKVVGTAEGNYFIEMLNQYCQEENISVVYKYINDPDELHTALEIGEVDLILSGSIQKIPRAKVALRFASERIYYATAKGNRMVLDKLNYALNEIRREDVYYDAKLQDKYYKNTTLSTETFTQEEREYIKTHPNLKIIFHEDWKPIDYYDKATNSFSGISMDVVKEITKYSGISFEYLYMDNYEEAFQMLHRGEADVSAALINSQVILNKQHIKLTRPYIDPALVFIGKRGSELGNVMFGSAAVQKGIIGTTYRMEEYYPNIHTKPYGSAKECLDAVLKGETDYAVLNSYSADENLRGSQYNSLTIVSSMQETCPVSMGVAENAPAPLLSILNKSINAITSSKMNEIVFRHTVGIPYQPTTKELIEQNLPLFFIIFIVLISCFFIFIMIFRAKQAKELNQLAYYDTLTGTMNLVKFKIELKKLLEDRPKRKLALLSLDIDKFKSANESLGYAYGDRMIMNLSNCIAEHLEDGEFFARENADQFIILMHYSDKENFEQRFFDISDSADRMHHMDASKIRLVLSGGLYLLKQEDTSIVAMIDRANFARKFAKHNHESMYAVYDEQLYEQLNHEKDIENVMADALQRGEFQVYLQPKFSVQTGLLAGAEALVRWNSPEKGMISPNEFIPLFEKNGFVVNLDLYIFRQVCIKLNQWIGEGLPVVPVSVNLSRRHIDNAGLAGTLSAIAQECGVTPKLIELELTESAFSVTDDDTLVRIVNELHEAGFTVSMDDFGSGLSSLTQLKELPIDVLKLDKSLLSANTDSLREKALFTNVVKLSKDMGIVSVAEGVETTAQYHMIFEAHCDIVQGYLFARPMPINEFETAFLHSSAVTEICVPIPEEKIKPADGMV